MGDTRNQEKKDLDSIVSNLILVHDNKIICNIPEILANEIKTAKKYKKPSELARMIAELDKASRKKHLDTSHPYYACLEILYEKIKTGEIRSWSNLSRKRRHFFSWNVNLGGVIYIATQKYLLPQYECTLEDLPIQTQLRKKMLELNIYPWRRYNQIRDLFLVAYPEMRNSPHWHPARWRRSSKRKLSEAEKEEYSRFRRDYLFRHRLKCKTKEDVLNALNNDKTLREALRAEKIYNRIYVTSSKPWHVFRRHPHTLIEDLEGRMYDIDPWEIQTRIKSMTFRNKDGTYNKEVVGKYLLWAHRTHRLPLNNLRCAKAAKRIPYYFPIRQNFSADEIRKMLKKAEKKYG